MHAHDRTLLARLGFADPDKQEPRHDLACQFLAVKENAVRLIGMRRKFSEEIIQDEWLNDNHQCNVQTGGVHIQSEPTYDGPRFESPISKGDGQYKVVVGFLDMVLRYSWTSCKTTCSRTQQRSWKRRDGFLSGEYEWSEWSEWSDAKTVGDDYHSELRIEVKIQTIPIGDIIRQAEMYREHGACLHVVATTWDLSDYSIMALREAGLTHIRLGQRFDEFCKTASARTHNSEEF